MAEVAQLLRIERVHREGGGAIRTAVPHPLYFAFLSYSHADAGWGEWLHDELEKFRVPSSLAGRLTAQGVVPKRLTPIFRDRKELAASGDLGAEIREALVASRFLIELCSPSAASSRWTNAEIDTFKRVRPDGCVLAAIVDGEPFASEIPGHEGEECLPPALRIRYDRRGHPTAKRAEPLCTDLREHRDGKRLGFLKLVAGMLGVGLDALVQREAVRRQRRLAMLAAASLGGMAITSGLAVTAIEARDAARDQRREAEGLISYMLGDLQQKLEPIGRLDALDGVGARVLAYYRKQDTSDLTDSALTQRSRALALMANVAMSRGKLEESARLYREAAAGTAEAMRRSPGDAQRVFEHAQNTFYLAFIALQRGEAEGAERLFNDYARLAARMVALDPDNMKYRMEVQNAHANLGIVMYDQRRFEEASKQFEEALRTIEAIATADPENGEYQKSLVESLAWAADAHAAAGRLDAATVERQRHVLLLDRLLEQSGGDVGYGEKLIPAHRALGKLYAVRGRLDLAVAQAREAAAHAEQLLAVERSNSMWHEYTARARLNLAEYYLKTGDRSQAAAELQSACALAQSLISKDRTVSQWLALRRDCLMNQVSLDLASGSAARALSSAVQALRLAQSVKSSDPIEDSFAVAKAHRLMGDAQRLSGNGSAALEAWTRALASVPRTTAERPSETSEHQLILKRLGRTAAARQLAARLAAIGYRESEFQIG